MTGSTKPPGRRTWSRYFLQGLQASVSGNAHAFGYSITITVTFGVVSTMEEAPTLGELVVFAMAAVAAFSLLNIVALVLTRRSPGTEEPRRVVLVATATDFLAVAAGVGAAIGLCLVLDGWWAWIVAPFCATLAYALVQTLELAVGREESGPAEE